MRYEQPNQGHHTQLKAQRLASTGGPSTEEVAANSLHRSLRNNTVRRIQRNPAQRRSFRLVRWLIEITRCCPASCNMASFSAVLDSLVETAAVLLEAVRCLRPILRFSESSESPRHNLHPDPHAMTSRKMEAVTGHLQCQLLSHCPRSELRTLLCDRTSCVSSIDGCVNTTESTLRPIANEP